VSRSVGADEGFDDDGPEFRTPLSPEDRVWRHPSELGAAALTASNDRSTGRSPWAVGFVSVVGGVLLAGSLMFAAGGVGDEPGRIALRPIATLAPRIDDTRTIRIAALDGPAAPPALVGIDVNTATDVRMGNGLAVQSAGYVVTTAALVADASDIRVTASDGRAHTATIVGVDDLNDLAVIHVDDLDVAPAVLDRQVSVTLGQSVFVVGASRGVATSTRTAEVTSLDARLSSGGCDLHGAVQLDATLDVSTAGAPLLSSDGRILGLVTTRAADRPAVAIPTRTIAWVAQQLVAAGQVQHGWLGVEGVTAIAPDTTADAPDDGGALVNRVVDSSPAQDAGLLADDIVVAIDGEPVSTMSELVVAVRERAPGTTVTVSLVRGGARHDLPVSLAESPPSF
jgi:putative serine protease PepD